jgi:hypothetical protein
LRATKEKIIKKLNKMNKFTLHFLLGLLLAPIFMYGQHHTVIVEPRVPERFRVGDMYYPSSYRGLSLLMADIETDNPVLYAKLAPSFNVIKSNMNKSVMSVAAGGILGTTMIVGGFTFLQKNSTEVSIFPPGSYFYEEPKEVKGINFVVIFGGFGIYTAGLVAGLIFMPKEGDIYRFVNLHNKNNPDQKMEWDLGFDLVQNKAPGLKLSLNF